MQTITASQFHQHHQTGEKLTVIDVRTHAEVATECLKGSAHFPVQTIDAAAVQAHLQQQRHRPEKPIYLLCANGPRATMAAEKLAAHLDSDLTVIEGGLDALKQLNIETQQGARNVISLERQVRIAAGSLVVVGVLLGLLVSPWFFGLSGFVGAGLAFAGITDTCAMAMMLAGMPWNNRAAQQ